LEEVERNALTRENGPGQPRDLKQGLIRSNAVAVVGMPGQLDSWIQLTEYLSHPRAAAQGRLLAGDDFTCDPLCGGDQLSGDITAADVLSQGSCDLLSEVGWKLQHLRRLSCGRAPHRKRIRCTTPVLPR